MSLVRRSAAVITAAAILAAAPVLAKQPETEEQKTLYAVGQIVAKQLSVFTLTAEELEWVVAGAKDGVTGEKPAIDQSQYNDKVQELAKKRRSATAEKQAAANKAYLETAAKEKGAIKSDSGLIFFNVKEGTGESPKGTDTVKVHYKGTLVDGREFDSSFKRGKPVELPLGNVIKCWTEGVQKMKPGGKAKLVCPSTIAYGENGAGEMILPGATLLFDIELIEVLKKEPAPAKK